MNSANLAILAQLLITLLGQAQAAGHLLRKAHEEGRDVTDAELDALVAGDDAARDTLQRVIDAARNGG